MIRLGRGKSQRVRAADIALPASGDEHPFTLVRNGYTISEVAAFVSSMSVDMTGLTPQDLRRVSFSVDRRGYDKAEVNAYLGRIAAEIEAELAEARAAARAERVAALEPELVVREPVVTEPPPVEAPSRPQPEVVYYTEAPKQPTADASNRGTGREIMWLTPEEFEAGGTTTPNRGPQRPPETVAPPTAPAPGASSEIAALLRDAHDAALRLRAQAEADVRTTIDAARSAVEQRTANQLRELAAQREQSQRQQADLLHRAELHAIETRNQADRAAAETRAAAEAVMAQARAEVSAVQALTRHNLAEIEAHRQESVSQAREMLSLGRGMLTSIIDLNRQVDDRLAHTRALLSTARSAVS